MQQMSTYLMSDTSLICVDVNFMTRSIYTGNVCANVDEIGGETVISMTRKFRAIIFGCRSVRGRARAVVKKSFIILDC